MSSKAIGIDLGTTNSCVALLQNGKVEVLANDFGHRTTPSVVAFLDKEEREIVGEAALNQASRNPKNTIYEFKRVIGRDWNERSVQEDLKDWPFEVFDQGGEPRFRITHKDVTKTFSPIEISAMILRKLKDTADAFLGEPVSEAVITVPAYFTDQQLRATKEAGEMAGLKVLRLMPEPSAAALAYGVDRMGGVMDKKVVVYDLGGGTFDVSIASVNGRQVKVRSIGGNSHLGGKDFDQRIIDHVVQEINRKLGRDLRQDPKKMRRLLSLCERAKHDLSALAMAEIDVESLVAEELTIVITRAKYEELCKDLLTSTMDTAKSVLATAKMQPGDIDEVILVGGSTRMPCVQRMLQDLFPGKEVCKTINPDEAVASGAALLAAHLAGEEADILTGMVVQNVTPLSIGTNVNGGEFRVIVPRNTAIPVRKEIYANTAFHNQNNIPCMVYQGERLLAERNKFLGVFVMHDLPPAPAGLRVDMALELDEDGLLAVQAKVHSSEQWQGCTLQLCERNATEVVDHLADAERFQEDDRREIERLRTRLHLEKYLRNKRNEVKEDTVKTAILWETMDWFVKNREATTQEFTQRLVDLQSQMGDSEQLPYLSFKPQSKDNSSWRSEFFE